MPRILVIDDDAQLRMMWYVKSGHTVKLLFVSLYVHYSKSDKVLDIEVVAT
ncbi:MAG: hypothetical protein ACI8V2_004876 [Candidatus Latescibacterota bacterium]|jgi:hypothetical protein